MRRFLSGNNRMQPIYHLIAPDLESIGKDSFASIDWREESTITYSNGSTRTNVHQDFMRDDTNLLTVLQEVAEGIDKLLVSEVTPTP